jgi:hypothetical protein
VATVHDAVKEMIGANLNLVQIFHVYPRRTNLLGMVG